MTATMGEPEGRRGRLTEFAITLGHYADLAWFAGCCIVAIQNIVAALTKGLLNAVMGWAGTAALVTMFVTRIAEILYHSRNMCLRDVAGSKVLLDPQSEIAKHDRKLRIMHWPVKINVAAILLVLILTFWSSSIGKILGFPLAGAAVSVFAMAIAGYLLLAGIVHTRLQPWCPYCRRRRGPDDPTPEPVPDPDPSIKVNA